MYIFYFLYKRMSSFYNIVMIFLKTKKAWSKYINESKKHYNLNDLNNTLQEPEEYPCLVERYLTTDMNGINLRFVFVYKTDIKKFK